MCRALTNEANTHNPSDWSQVQILPVPFQGLSKRFANLCGTSHFLKNEVFTTSENTLVFNANKIFTSCPDWWSLHTLV